MSGLNGFMYGKSVFKKIIEDWWGTMSRQGMQKWIFYQILKG